MITDKEVSQQINPFLNLNFSEEGNKITIIKVIRRLINSQITTNRDTSTNSHINAL